MTIKLTRLDLNYILTQIEMAEAGQQVVNPLLSFGLREIDGTNNNLTAGGSKFGSAFQPMPTLTDPLFRNAQAGTSYSQTSGLVIDSQPRTISLLVANSGIKILAPGPDGVNGTADDVLQVNAAALAAQQRALGLLGPGYQNYTLPGPDGIYGNADDTGTTFAGPNGKLGTADDITTFGNLATPTNASNSSSTIPGLVQSLFIPNVTPDNGLSAPFNSFFTIFGQFFDHGLDLIDKNGPTQGFVFIPLTPEDPLYVAGSPNNFMAMDRAQMLPGPDGILGTADDVHQFTNSITPFIDQSQTYGSDPSHDAFLRQYMIGADGKLHSTGKLLSGALLTSATGVTHTSLATWADLKASAAQFLGIKLTDLDVNSIPLLATDAYGNLILGAHGLAQLVESVNGVQVLREGNLANPITTDANTLRVGAGFIDDKAPTADPVDPVTGRFLVADADTTLGNTPLAGQYDNELLNQHKVAGDGRLNENLGLTAIQQIFHSEHDRLVAQIEALVQTNLNNGDISFAGDWVLPGVDLSQPGRVIQANEWNGDRIFQAAKFGTETEYQHIVFEEFARMVAPSIHVAGGVNVHIDPAITSEFANVVYRFGHSMLDENLNIYTLGADGKPVIGANGQPVMSAEGLIDAFTNPLKFVSDPNMTADLVMGMTNQVGNEIDEFVTGTLENNLDGAPLDLAAINITRGRDTGVAPLNLVRNQLFSQSGEGQLKAYTSWADFGSQLKHIESLVNFIAAYGTHSTITKQVQVAGKPLGTLRDQTNAEKVAAAQALVANGALGSATFSLDAYQFLNSQGQYANNKADARAVHDSAGVAAVWGTGSVTGLDNVDMWIGGLAEKQSLFGGVLGSTFEYVFRTQMEALQDADRLYYLPRIEGTDYEESLQDSSLAQLIRANTDIAHPAGNIFQTPEYTIEASNYFNVNVDGSLTAKDPLNANHTWLTNPTTGALMVNINPDGTLVFVGDNNFLGNDIVMGGTAGNDKLTAGPSDGDTIWGDGGNDVIDGGGGNDFLFGGDGNDTVIGGQGLDTLHGDAGDDTIYGGDGLDNIFGGDGNDYIEGGRGDDIVFGGLGNDIIIGNEGFDQLIGDQGDDWLESRGGQGQLMFGDSGAPTGQQPLYSGNDVMVGGVAGGDIMKGFSGDDIMLGHGSFTKFIGGLGFDWGSYELATQGVDEDMNRKEFVAANGAVDNVRDVWQGTEGASGSAFDDVILGDNATKLLTTKDELDNVNLIAGLAGFFDPGVVSFDGGNIILGGDGSDTLIGGGGNDIIDGDAFLHVGLSSYTAGGTIIRQILEDPNGNTYQGMEANQFTFNGNGLINNFVAGTGHVNPLNVDTAVYHGIRDNYSMFPGAVDGEGFFTITQTVPTVVVGANPQGVLGANDDTDRVRHIERLQFSNETVAIDSLGNVITSSLIHIAGATNIANYEIAYGKYYDAVPFGTPSMTETDPAGNVVDPTVAVVVDDTLHGSVSLISDLDNLMDAKGNVIAGASDAISNAHYQWQYVDAVSGNYVDYAGATSADFVVTPFLVLNSLGVRLKVSYVDGKGYTEQLFSNPSINTVTLPVAGGNTAPFINAGTQFNGIGNTTAVAGQNFDFFTPLTSIFNDAQTTPDLLVYTATLLDGSPLFNANLKFTQLPGVLAPPGGAGASLAGEFTSIAAGPDGVLGTADDVAGPLNTVEQIGVRVRATDAGGLSVTNTFFINVQSPNNPPVAANDSYATLENVGLTAVLSTGLLHNDIDPGQNPMTAILLTGPAHGTLLKTDGTPGINPDGTFVYIPTAGFFGTDSFTYQDTDSAQLVSNIATATITVTKNNVPVTEHLVQDTGISAFDNITNKAAVAGSGNPTATVSGTIDAGTANAASFTTTSDATGAWAFTPALADGVHTIVVTETNILVAGAITTASLTITLDTKAPVVTETLVSDTGTSSTDKVTSNPALSGTGDLNAAVLVSIDGGVAVSVPTDATGKWTFTPVLADGSHTVVVTETDTAGNIGAGIPFTFTLDTKAPPVTVALVKDTGISATDGITSNPALTGKGDPNAAVLISIDGGTATSVATNATGVWNFTPAVANGAHTVVVTETDPAGNVGTGSLTFTLDTTAPATPVLGPFTFVASKNTLTSYTFSGTAEAGSSVVLTNGAVTLGTVTTAANGTWSFTTLPANKAANVGTTVTATATDLAGNVSASTAVIGLVIAAVDNAKLTATGNTPTFMLALGKGETLTGGGGNDTFFATVGGGSNTLTGGGGTDTYNLSQNVEQTGQTNIVNLGIGGKGTAAIAGGGTDTLNNFQNVIGGSGSNDITGNGAGSVLTGGVGSVAGSTNILRDGNPVNGTGSAVMIGNSGSDQFFVNSAKDTVTENFVGGVADIVMTTLNSYTLGANVENLRFIGTAGTTFTGTGNALANTITGGNGVNTLDGGAGNDTLRGGTGNDFLTGGAGSDTMTGNGGNDTFKYLTVGFGADTITDFIAHTGAATNKDLLDLSGLGITAATFATSVKIVATGLNNVNTTVTVGNGTTTGGTILLLGVTSTNVNITDFIHA
jgi:Ca2+-binding RTX toxin-like protein